MCLITDYSPENLTLSFTEEHTNAVVEVATSKNKQESSYVTTYWGKKDAMQCGASHDGFGKLAGEDPESGNGIAGCAQGLAVLWARCCYYEQNLLTSPSPAGDA